jgi:plasmid stability protein
MVGTITLSIEKVPKAVVERLNERAARNGRSLQDELQSILAQAVRTTTLDELASLAKMLGIKSEAGESVRMIREDRDDPNR